MSKVAALKPGAQVELAGRHGREPYSIKLTGHRTADPPGAAEPPRSQAGVRRMRAPSCCSFSSMAS